LPFKCNLQRYTAKPLYMLVFFTSIAMIIFSSLIYYVVGLCRLNQVDP
jgi:hypothetical protein